MAKKNYKINQLQEDDTLLEIRPETDAEVVLVEKSDAAYKGNADNVQDALEEIYAMAQDGVAGVSGSATIATENNGIVTIKAGINQTNGVISNSTASDIVLGSAAKLGVTKEVTNSSGDVDLATAKAVYDAIHNAIGDLTKPMIFKGSVGTNGTLSTLPSASADNEGFVYKVITDGIYGGQVAKIGDTLISNGTKWELIPSGDEPNGTVTSVNVVADSGSGLTVSGGPITSSGAMSVGVASGYSIPSLTLQNGWSAKYSKPSDGIPKSDLESAVQESLLKADTALQGNQSIDISGDATGSGSTSIKLTLAKTGVTSGSYSAVTVNDKGLVTAGAQLIEIGGTNQTKPSTSLAIGGLFFEEI